jgi:hypothetical protein
MYLALLIASIYMRLRKAQNLRLFWQRTFFAGLVLGIVSTCWMKFSVSLFSRSQLDWSSTPPRISMPFSFTREKYHFAIERIQTTEFNLKIILLAFAHRFPFAEPISLFQFFGANFPLPISLTVSDLTRIFAIIVRGTWCVLQPFVLESMMDLPNILNLVLQTLPSFLFFSCYLIVLFMWYAGLLLKLRTSTCIISDYSPSGPRYITTSTIRQVSK